MQGKFPLGQTVMTRAIHEFMQENGGLGVEVAVLIARHHAGDWGDVPKTDARANNRSLKEGTRLLSAYTLAGRKVWIITEADRSVTTLLFPEDY